MTPSNALQCDVRPSPSFEAHSFLADCLRGLSHPQKSIPCKWLYDDAGSILFDEICGAEEYYPSRVEAGLLAEAAPSLARMIALDTVLVEFGSGASRKTRALLDAAPAITAYVPIDISDTELQRAVTAIEQAYPHLKLFPVLGDFTQTIALDPSLAGRPRFGFFSGSTLGNFVPDEAINFLSLARSLMGPDSRLLLGIDLAKDVDILLAAYDDAAGITAEFNLNLLARMNRELDCSIDLAAFEHRAIWNAAHSRIEMHLVSTRDQEILVGGERFTLDAGETIHTENSHKFSLDALTTMFAASGWAMETQWISDEPRYALILLGC